MSFLKNLTKFPKSAIYGIAFLIAGWAWFFFTLYILFREIPGKILIVGIGIIFLVFKGYNWARILCILFNLLMVIYVLFFAFHLWGIGRGSEALCFAGNIILFGYSGYYLFVKETSDYFKSINEQDKKAEKDA
ncbi:MAG: hypothetical protein JRJ49_07560 [Deltaproteobacteria bacterium]|nr:hypothetical protein [Deltaproteobacteria bacterium]